MPYKNYWIVEGRLLEGHYSGQITLEDIEKANRLTLEKLHAYPERTIDMIADATAVTDIPPVHRLRNILTFIQEPNVGWMMTVGTTGFVRVLAGTITQLTRMKYRFVDTREDALAFLYRHDPALQSLVEQA